MLSPARPVQKHPPFFRFHPWFSCGLLVAVLLLAVILFACAVLLVAAILFADAVLLAAVISFACAVLLLVFISFAGSCTSPWGC